MILTTMRQIVGGATIVGEDELLMYAVKMDKLRSRNAQKRQSASSICGVGREFPIRSASARARRRAFSAVVGGARPFGAEETIPLSRKLRHDASQLISSVLSPSGFGGGDAAARGVHGTGTASGRALRAHLAHNEHGLLPPVSTSPYPVANPKAAMVFSNADAEAEPGVVSEVHYLPGTCVRRSD